jgi:hypothetical protein
MRALLTARLRRAVDAIYAAAWIGACLFIATCEARASGGFSPAPVKVAIPLDGAWCLDAGSTAQDWSYTTRPELVVAGQRLGPVMPGSCAWLGGYVRRGVRVQLACGALLSAPAEWAAVPGGAALCAVPADQDFR